MSSEHGYKQHLFICTNAPHKDGKCGSKGADDLRSAMKETIRDLGLKKEIRVNSSGCLGYCDEGIACVLYPEGKWFTDLKKDDTKILEQALGIRKK